MRFFLDMNLPPAMAEWLRSEGHEAAHIRESGLAHLPDRETFARAAVEGRIVVAFDLDFGEMAGLVGATGATVVLLRFRMARQDYLRRRLQTSNCRDGVTVVVEDARIRIRRRSPGN